jgi:hypothetical protein
MGPIAGYLTSISGAFLMGGCQYSYVLPARGVCGGEEKEGKEKKEKRKVEPF